MNPLMQQALVARELAARQAGARDVRLGRLVAAVQILPSPSGIPNWLMVRWGDRSWHRALAAEEVADVSVEEFAARLQGWVIGAIQRRVLLIEEEAS
jgi:hypothetical protein